MTDEAKPPKEGPAGASKRPRKPASDGAKPPRKPSAKKPAAKKAAAKDSAAKEPVAKDPGAMKAESDAAAAADPFADIVGPEAVTEVVATDAATTQIMADAQPTQVMQASLGTATAPPAPPFAPVPRVVTPSGGDERTTLWLVIALAALAVLAVVLVWAFVLRDSGEEFVGNWAPVEGGGGGLVVTLRDGDFEVTMFDEGLELMGTYPAARDGDTLTFRFTDTQSGRGLMKATLTHDEERGRAHPSADHRGCPGSGAGVRARRRPRGGRLTDAHTHADGQRDAVAEPLAFADWVGVPLALPDAVTHGHRHDSVRPAGTDRHPRDQQRAERVVHSQREHVSTRRGGHARRRTGPVRLAVADEPLHR